MTVFRFIAAVIFVSATVGLAQTPGRPNPESPENIGRTELVRSLNRLAAADEAGRHETVTAITTREQAESRQRQVRAKVLSLIGGLPDHTTPLNAKTMGSTQAMGFRIEKILYESQPGFYVTALLYLPDGQAGAKLPAILMAPGHSPSGKAGDATLAATFARNGFAVLSYDPIGQGERLQYPDPAHPTTSLASRPTGEHGEASLQPMLLGDAVARYFVNDAIRGIDYLSSRAEIDPHRIGAFGCSGGGTVTAMTAALDPRVAVAGVACYNTSFDALLAGVGPQDGEQSIAGFISSGLDLSDWIELFAPRPYAAISTYGDMFPFAGAITTVREARRFYSLFDPAAAGIPTDKPAPDLTRLTEPALNVDTTATVATTAPFQFITGPGGHGALQPIAGSIVSFFIRNMHPPGANPEHPVLVPRSELTGLPATAFQVTSTGQIASSFPGAATVFTLNQRRFAMLPPTPHPTGLATLDAEVRSVTGYSDVPKHEPSTLAIGPVVFSSGEGVQVRGELAVPSAPGHHPAVLLLVPGPLHAENSIARANLANFSALAAAGNVVLAFTPTPSPPGTDDMKSPILGPFYLLSLRAGLAGQTLIGLRMRDIVEGYRILAARPDVDAKQISAMASGHLALALVHAAVLIPGLRHLHVDHILSSYKSLVDAPLPIGAPEDLLPGVLRHYDIPDLVRALGARITSDAPQPGTADLSHDSTPVATLMRD